MPLASPRKSAARALRGEGAQRASSRCCWGRRSPQAVEEEMRGESETEVIERFQRPCMSEVEFTVAEKRWLRGDRAKTRRNEEELREKERERERHKQTKNRCNPSPPTSLSAFDDNKRTKIDYIVTIWRVRALPLPQTLERELKGNEGITRTRCTLIFAHISWSLG